MPKADRKSGFYWVRWGFGYSQETAWQPAYFKDGFFDDSGAWWALGWDGVLCDVDMAEIGPEIRNWPT
jgi:hypothetical protein